MLPVGKYWYLEYGSLLHPPHLAVTSINSLLYTSSRAVHVARLTWCCHCTPAHSSSFSSSSRCHLGVPRPSRTKCWKRMKFSFLIKTRTLFSVLIHHAPLTPLLSFKSKPRQMAGPSSSQWVDQRHLLIQHMVPFILQQIAPCSSRTKVNGIHIQSS